MAQGMPMMGTRTRPALVRRHAGRRFRITLQEGKNRQIRRMVRKIGNQVVALKRIRMATIRLGNLKEGQWRHLSAGEVERLLGALPPSAAGEG
jgi:23S rRNA pseudouridine2605 synthase/23S rRNA pseudouridine2604 synthase